MKLKIMIMALLLLAGIGSAVNRLPATEFTGDIDFMDGYYARNATDGIINVKDYGALGDGATDDTAALKAAIAQGGYIYFPDGTYMLQVEFSPTASRGISIPNDTIIQFSGNAWIKLLSHDTTHYNIFSMDGVQNVTIYDAKIDGNRSGNANATGEWGYGFLIYNGCKNINLINPTAINCWGDGINLNSAETTTAHNENIYIENAFCDNNRRQGMSIEDADGLVVRGGVFSNSNGINPQFGIDIEPWHINQTIRNVLLDGPRTDGNYYGGIEIFLKYIDYANRTIDITVRDHVDVGPDTPTSATYSSIFVGDIENVKGSIKFYNPTSIDSSGSAYRQDSKGADAALVEIFDPVVINPNQINSSDSTLASVFVIGGRSGTGGTFSSGGVYIYNPRIWIDSDSYAVPSAYYAYDGRSGGSDMSNLVLENPKWNNATKFTLPIECYLGAESTGDFRIVDNFEMLRRSPNAAYDLSNKYITTYVDDSAFTAARTITWYNTYPVGASTTYEIINGVHLMTIDPPNDVRIYPTGTGLGKYIRSNTAGSKITLTKYNASAWMATDIVGTWEAEA